MTRIELTDLSVERSGNIAIVRIDRGVASNAARPETMQQLCNVLDEMRDDKTVRALVLGHRGKHFMAGGDFAFLQTLQDATMTEIKNNIYGLFQGAVRRLYAFPKPTVAAIGGAAITVGCEAAIACDFRIVTERALFQESWIKLGLIPPLGGLKTLPALVGYGVASDMILRGRGVGGTEAVAIGLAHSLVGEDELEAKALALANELAEQAPLAYEAAKAGLQRALESSYEQTFSHSVLTQSFLIKSRDFREGVAAVMQGRCGEFKGE
jgi:enoyl-CoA hydratase/carnithine racemase